MTSGNVGAPFASKKSLRIAVLIDAAHFRILAVCTELLRRIDREQHCFPFANIGTKLFASEIDKPDVFLARHQIANALPIRNECWRSRRFTRLCRLTEPKPKHDVSPSFFTQARKITRLAFNADTSNPFRQSRLNLLATMQISRCDGWGTSQHDRNIGPNLALLRAFSINKPVIRPRARNNVILL